MPYESIPSSACPRARYNARSVSKLRLQYRLFAPRVQGARNFAGFSPPVRFSRSTARVSQSGRLAATRRKAKIFCSPFQPIRPRLRSLSEETSLLNLRAISCEIRARYSSLFVFPRWCTAYVLRVSVSGCRIDISIAIHGAANRSRVDGEITVATRCKYLGKLDRAASDPLCPLYGAERIGKSERRRWEWVSGNFETCIVSRRVAELVAPF